jgi:hypothetical protein
VPEVLEQILVMRDEGQYRQCITDSDLHSLVLIGHSWVYFPQET